MPAPEIIILRQSDGYILRTDGRVMRSKDGIYTTWELDDLIYNQSYVPVASAAELNSLRNTGSRTMGAGTIWAGTYTTGLDKKYIQTNNFDFGLFTGTWNRLELSDTYDGNNMVISNFKLITAFEGLFLNNNFTSRKLRNIRITNIVADGQTLQNMGMITNTNTSGSVISNVRIFNSSITASSTFSYISGSNNGLIENCKVHNCSFTCTSDGQGGITALNNSTGTVRGCVVEFCDFRNETGANTNVWVGGIVGRNVGGIIEYCKVLSTTIIGQRQNAGIAGQNSNGIVRYCYAHGYFQSLASISFPQCSPIVGYNNGAAAQIQNCIGDGVVKYTGTLETCCHAGVCGYNEGVVSNCYSIAFIDTTRGGRGGLVGVNVNTVTNSYYDTQTSGQSDTGKGLPRTTAQMKAGTASSFILANGDIDPDSLAANAMYTSWSTAIWDFRTTNDYPILKP